MLTKNEIIKQMEIGNIVISPLKEGALSGPNSCDLHLGKTLMVYTDEVLDIKKQNETTSFEIPEEGYVLLPGILYLGETEEYTETRGFVPKIDGVSSGARLGLTVHKTAGFGDIGFCGKWTLEITVDHPLRVYPGSRVAQIYYDVPIGEIADTYHGKYQNSDGVKASRSYEDYTRKVEDAE